MKVLFRVLRFLIAYIAGGAVMLLSGYGSLMKNIKPDATVRIFLLSTLVLAIILVLIWEMYLSFKNKINDLTKKIDKLEQNK